MKVLVVGPFCWGKGDTVAEAFKNALANAPVDYRDTRYKRSTGK